ncbi:MAG TPA: hypothetical protein VMF65_24205 [Acidimicrobiales bacterium]|nr:hypothetical protein [Acidimicrobiales bacterium]
MSSTPIGSLRHTVAIAGLYTALLDVGPNVGLRLTEWRRDEEAWEDWSSHCGTGRRALPIRAQYMDDRCVSV